MKFIPGCFVVAILAGSARADSIWISTSGSTANAIETNDSTITKVEGNRLYFIAGNAETSREFSQISRIAVADDPALTAAELDYSKGQWDAAADDYQRAMAAPARAWMKDWEAVRLLDSAAKAGRFDAAVSAYVSLVQSRPDIAEKSRPVASAAKPSQLDAAATQLTTATTRAGYTDSQQRSLLTLLFDVQQARNDTPAAAAVADKLLKLAPSDAAQSARWRLAIASSMIDRHDFPAALAAIQANRAAFTDPATQSQAMFLIARAKEAAATDPDSLKDAALAYMRVVSFFKDTPGAVHVNDSLQRAAAILDRLNDKPAADRLRASQ
jgi:hypothetical protein